MTPKQSAAVERLRQALAAGPTDGPWEFGSYARGEIRLGPQGESKHSAFATMVGRADFPWDANDESRWAFTLATHITTCDPATIRTLLAALDEAQRPPTNAQITAALDAWFGPSDQPETRPFGVRMRAAIDAARASAGGAA